MSNEALEQAQLKKFEAEAGAYLAEQRYNDLQSERLLRVKEEEDADVSNQRILDFVTEVTDSSVYHAIKRLSEWRHRSPEPITIRFNTPGGDIIAGVALYDYVQTLKGESIVVKAEGLGMVASMGAVLLQCGTTRAMSKGCWLMIHELSTYNEGKLSEVKDTTKWLERAQLKLDHILTERSTLTLAQLRRRTSKGKDWWLDAGEALKYGFIDSIT